MSRSRRPGVAMNALSVCASAVSPVMHRMMTAITLGPRLASSTKWTVGRRSLAGRFEWVGADCNLDG